MKSLFEKEELEIALNQIKIGLISRFYPLSKDDVEKYRSILNFDRYHLMMNEYVEWDNELLDVIGDRIDWSAIYKIQNIQLNFDFFKKFEDKIDFSTIHYSKSIKWSEALLNVYGEKFDWSRGLIAREELATVENLRRFKDKLNWSFISQKIEVNDEILAEFSEKWDWKKLSGNKSLPITVEFIKENIEKLDFDALSQNPKSLGLIYKYPLSKKWNWKKIILNPAIHYDKETFAFVFQNFKRQLEEKIIVNPISIKRALPTFLCYVFAGSRNDASFFLNDEFIDAMPWEFLCSNSTTKLPLEFIVKHKEKLNFKNSNFLRNSRNTLTAEFINTNIKLFDLNDSSCHYLPLTIDLLNKNFEKVNWNFLSSNVTLDWSWDFINIHFDKFNLFKLSENEGLFTKLIYNDMTKQEVFEFLDKETSYGKR